MLRGICFLVDFMSKRHAVVATVLEKSSLGDAEVAFVFGKHLFRGDMLTWHRLSQRIFA